MNCPLTRRTFLRASGVSLALPLLETMNPVRASENSGRGNPPKRMVVICTALGLHAPALFPKAAGADYGQTEYLDILKAHRSDYTLFSGLSHSDQNGREGHSQHMTWLTSAPNPGLAGFRNTISVDQLASEKLGYVTRFPSLALSSMGPSSQSYTRSGVMVPAEHKPSNLFAKMFLQGNPQEVKRQKTNLSDGRSILDSLLAQTYTLMRSVSSTDRQRLDEYFQSIRKAEQNLTKAQQWLDTSKPATSEEQPKDIADPTDFIGRSQLVMDMVPLVIQSDSSRVIAVAIQDHHLVPQVAGVSEEHHSLSHHGQDEAKIKQLKKIEKEIVNCFNGLLNQLKEKKEAGTSLLDSTSVLFGSNLGNASAHDWHNLPIVLAGGAHKHGQYVAYDKDNNTPLCNLFLTMLHDVGVEANSFGNSSGTLTW